MRHTPGKEFRFSGKVRSCDTLTVVAFLFWQDTAVGTHDTAARQVLCKRTSASPCSTTAFDVQLFRLSHPNATSPCLMPRRPSLSLTLPCHDLLAMPCYVLRTSLSLTIYTLPQASGRTTSSREGARQPGHRGTPLPALVRHWAGAAAPPGHWAGGEIGPRRNQDQIRCWDALRTVEYLRTPIHGVKHERHPSPLF